MVFALNLIELIFTPLVEFQNFTLYPYHLVSFVIIMGVARLISFIFRVLITKYSERKGLGKGSVISIHTIFKYFLYIFAFSIFLDNIGINVTVFLAGSTALFVGIGLGLQKTFNDFVSGVIILFEGSVKVGDILKVENEIGEVKEIRLRASMIESVDGKLLVVPNSKFVNESITNFTHLNNSVFFETDVIVSSENDPNKVVEALNDAVKEVKDIIDDPAPNVVFSDFGDEKLHFKVVYRTHKILGYSGVESQLRFKMYKKLAEHGIIY